MSRVILKVCVVLSLLIMFAAVPNVGAQSAASNKAFMLAGSNAITLTGVSAAEGGGVEILRANAAEKTSSNGALSASLSLECALWTYTQNVVQTTYNTTTRKSSGSSLVTAHAGVEVWVEIDGKEAEPGKVVYCDRLQAVGLSIVNQCNLYDTATGLPSTTNFCVVDQTVTLDLFQAIKNANSFNFYLGPLGTSIHSVVAYAKGFIECSKDGANVECPATILNSFADAKTAAAIGKRTIIIEEQQ